MSKREFKCEKCGETMSLDTSVVLTSYPAMYECFCEKCGHIQYIFCSEQNNYKWKRIKTELCEYKHECEVGDVSISGNQTITGSKLCVNGITVIHNEGAVLIEQIAKLKSLSDEITSNALQAVEKLDKEKQLVKSIIQSVYNGGQTYCTLPNGKEIVGDMGYIIDFYADVCKNYPELKEFFGQRGE